MMGCTCHVENSPVFKTRCQAWVESEGDLLLLLLDCVKGWRRSHSQAGSVSMLSDSIV